MSGIDTVGTIRSGPWPKIRDSTSPVIALVPVIQPPKSLPTPVQFFKSRHEREVGYISERPPYSSDSSIHLPTHLFSHIHLNLKMRFSLTTLALSLLSISAFAAPSPSSSDLEAESNSTLESRTFGKFCPSGTNWKLTKCCPWDSWEVPFKFRCECSTPGKTLSADGRSCENKCSNSGWKWCNTQCCPEGSDEVNGKCVVRPPLSPVILSTNS